MYPAADSSLRPLQPVESVTERTYRALRRALLRREIKPGERLLETTLAERLGVSRTPVREALTRLVAEGLAAEERGTRGVVVRDIRRELDEIYALRQLLEGHAARLAAERITDEELAELEALSQKIAACVHADSEDDAALHAHAEMTNEFHLLISKAACNGRLMRLISDFRDYFLSVEFLKMYDRATMARLQEQHETILAALRAHDGDEAERLVRRHFADALAVISVDSPEE